MRWLIRSLCWLFCGEFLLWTRGLMPPRVVLLIALALTPRLLLIATLPHYALTYGFWLLTALLLTFRYLRSFGSASRRLRSHYTVPETGLPWPSFITGPRPAPTLIGQFMFEPIVAIGLAYLIIAEPPALLMLQEKLPGLLPYPWWQELHSAGLPGLVPQTVSLAISPYLAPVHAWTRLYPDVAAFLQLVIPISVLVLHNLYDWNLLFPEARQERKAQGQPDVMHITKEPQSTHELAFGPVQVQRR